MPLLKLLECRGKLLLMLPRIGVTLRLQLLLRLEAVYLLGVRRCRPGNDRKGCGGYGSAQAAGGDDEGNGESSFHFCPFLTPVRPGESIPDGCMIAVRGQDPPSRRGRCKNRSASGLA